MYFYKKSEVFYIHFAKKSEVLIKHCSSSPKRRNVHSQAKACAPGQAEEFAKHYSGYIKDWYLKED